MLKLLAKPLYLLQYTKRWGWSCLRRYVRGIPPIFSHKIIISRWTFGSQPSAVIARVLNKNVVSWQTRNNRKLPKHKLSQNAKNLQCLLKFGLIEDNVTVFQWPWNSEWPWKILKGKKLRIFKKMLFSWEGLLNADKRQQLAKTIICICLHCSKSRAFTRP